MGIRQRCAGDMLPARAAMRASVYVPDLTTSATCPWVICAPGSGSRRWHRHISPYLKWDGVKAFTALTRINLGLSQDERDWNDLERRLTVDLRGNYVIAVMGAKGGVNKTTATICLGMALKQYRDEKIVAIDANPASGNLASRIKEPSTMSWRGLINDPNLRQYRDFRVYMGKDSKSGLEVLGSDPGDEVLTGNESGGGMAAFAGAVPDRHRRLW